MIDGKEVSDSIDLLYRTIDEPDQWEEWLRRTCNAFRADGGNVVYIPDGDAERGVYLQNFITPAQLDDYVRNFIDIDWQVEQFAGSPTGTTRVLTLEAQASYRDSRYFQEFASETCMWLSMGGIFRNDSVAFGRTGFHRRSERQPFSLQESRLLESFQTHLARVFEQSRYISHLEDCVAALGGGRDGVLLIDRAGRVAYRNDSAAGLMHGVMRIDTDRVSAVSRRDDDRLQAAVAAALDDTPPGQLRSAPAPVTLSMSRPGSLTPLLVTVGRSYRRSPYPHADAVSVRAVITIKDPAAPVAPNPEDLLKARYKVTTRELEVARLLVRGTPLKSISAQLDISHETVRSHVKSMTHKTGTRGQVQLVGMLARYFG